MNLENSQPFLHYKVSVLSPQTHFVQVRLEVSIPKDQQQSTWTLFLPSWSPGSYLMREYARFLRSFKAVGHHGERLYTQQLDKGAWLVDLKKIKNETNLSEFYIEYEVYAHELSVRTSWVDETHAFLHGPTYLLGIEGLPSRGFISFQFTPLWSKISTSLKPAKKRMESLEFVYEFESYDQLVDTPVEIGCHETDGFMAIGVPHHLAFYGVMYPNVQDLKSDIKKIVETIGTFMGAKLPYEQYQFITHFLPNVYGGLEHSDSTVLHFDGRKLNDRKEYVVWLGLVSHEYFHLWNVKRIRPQELGPFDYRNENYTRMLWLAEGLTAFMDNYFLLHGGLITDVEYLELIKKSLNMYHKTQGRKFESLEDSSFNAWIKLYRPHENLSNMTISYYLKGEFLFFWLASELLKQGSHIKIFVLELWSHYCARPQMGITKEEVVKIVSKISNPVLAEKFLYYVEGTEDFPWIEIYKNFGLKCVNEELKPFQKFQFGIDIETKGEQLWIKSVAMDGAAYQQGLNAGDELIALNGIRLGRGDLALLKENLMENSLYSFTVGRMGKLWEIKVIPKASESSIREFTIIDQIIWGAFKNS